MSILVTGGAGYIGSHTVLALLARGERVVVLDNLSTGSEALVPKEVTLVKGDVGDKELVRSIIREHSVSAIMHFAASIVVPESVAQPLKYYRNNTANALALIEVATEEGVPHFVFSSTAAVYGTPTTDSVSEDAPLLPVSPYGSSKVMTETFLRDTSKVLPLRYVALRYFNVAGADSKGRSGQTGPNATHLIRVACQTALGRRDSMTLYGTDYPTPDGTCVRDYIHVSDLADAHCAALEYLRTGGASDVFNCGYGRGYSVKEVLDTVKNVSGVDFTVTELPRRPGDPASIVADAHKIQEKLNWKATRADLELIVRDALAWERSLQ